MAPEFIWDMRYFGNGDDGAVNFAIRSPDVLIDLQAKPDSIKSHRDSRKLLQLIRKVSEGDYDAEQDFTEIIADECHSLLKQYFKMRSSKDRTHDKLTLQDYYGIKVTHQELAIVNGELKLRPRQDQKNTPHLLPEMAASLITSNFKISVPLMDAKRLRVLKRSWHQPHGLPITDPTLIQGSEGGTPKVYHFKQILIEQVGVRELGILLYLKEHRLISKHRLPSIAAIVHYANDPSRIMGFLLERIDHDRNLADYIVDGKVPPTLKDKWTRQIRDTIATLHQHGIVWGDAKPANVLIDRKGEDAWVVDFGGGHDPEYVDMKNVETVAGDLQGVEGIVQAMSQGNLWIRSNRPARAGH